jgi:ATP-dependent Clp protease adaptor protein ClpS
MSETATRTLTETRADPRTRRPRLWNVVLLDDQDHSYEYVIEMVQAVFGHSLERAFQIAKTVDSEGRAVCMTTHRELGELKVEQITCRGADRLIASCSGPMTAILEPAECGGDDDGGGDEPAR